MKLITHSPKKTLKAFLKQRPLEIERDKFKNNLITLLDKISVIEKQPKDESEEHLKNNLRDFLRDTFYIDSNAINTKDKKDLVIHIGKTTDTDVAVIIEAKRPSNKNEMISADNTNKKALHELILYYLTERKTKENVQLKQLVVTDIHQWFIIDANYFDKHIYRNTQIRKLYETKLNDKKDNPWFYEEIAKIVSKIDVEIPCVYFDIRDYEKILRNTNTEDDKELVALYKILSPQHLLKIALPNDSNTLNERFYKELLHIIGLEEAKEGTKNVIRRKKENKHAASLIELTIEALKTEDTFHRIPDIKVYGEKKEEQTFNIALELCITWINRILFLKLLEGQLISYHQGNKDYRFLNSAMIHDYDELFKLFHKVLAENLEERTDAVNIKYSRVPYLNSSLFIISDLEDQTIKINSLENDGQLELIKTTILKEIKKNSDKLPSLDYLFQFLDSYDFASEGTEDWQKDNKQLINASVLGKVFEKINGYQDGSIFTPAYITMYMCRQSIRLAVLDKFNEVLSVNGEKLFDKFDDIKNYTSRLYKTEDVLRANEIIDSLRICDPAVGSGHFLVSALNEIIAIKAELGILADEKGNNFSGYEIEIVNDELIITDQQGNLIEYKLHNGKPINKEVQRLQKALFHQKQTIIENCLFGVDINPKSVLICRLRLWIELLKNAYYKEAEYSELETLPNIDINIKCGNSLLSRFAIDTDLSPVLEKNKKTINNYREAVSSYKNSTSKEDKRGLLKIINDFKSDLVIGISQEDKKVKELNKKKSELFLLKSDNKLFDVDIVKGGKKLEKEKIKKLNIEISSLEKEIDDQKNNVVYKNAFEWRFEFPEVLNNKGEFEGFDLIIGNPPYGVSLKDKYREAIVNKLSKVPDYEIYYFFINLSKYLLKTNGIKTYIIPNTILFNVFAKKYRENLFQNWQIQEILDCTDFNVFEGSATVRCIITQFINKESNDIVYYRPTANVSSFDELKERKQNKTTKTLLLENNQNWALVFKLSSDVLQLVSKIKANKKSIEKHFPEFSQGLIAYDKYQGQDEHTIKNRVFHSNTKQSGWKKWLWGEDVTPYSVKWNGKEYINYCDGIANPREVKYFKGERILVREITNPKIFAGFTDEEGYNDPAIINIIKNKKGNFELKTLLAILNSKLATFYHFNSSPKATKGSFPKILVEDIKTFPLPSVSPSQQLNIIKLVDKIILLKKQSKDSSEQENKIEELVYKLYNITADEQKIIEG
jgi:adenine-specific DNA-methyltransferase